MDRECVPGANRNFPHTPILCLTKDQGKEIIFGLLLMTKQSIDS
jgi:hypothetical protein